MNATSRAPSILVEIPLEQPPTVWVSADTYEDEQRLSVWLGRPAATARVIDRLRAALLETFSE